MQARYLKVISRINHTQIYTISNSLYCLGHSRVWRSKLDISIYYSVSVEHVRVRYRYIRVNGDGELVNVNLEKYISRVQK